MWGRIISWSPWPERPRNSHEKRDRATLCEAGYRGATVRERLAAVTVFRPCGGFAIRLESLRESRTARSEVGPHAAGLFYKSRLHACNNSRGEKVRSSFPTKT